MTNKEINEFLAEKMDGLKRGVDFGENARTTTVRGNWYVDAPDYCSNAMPLIKKLLEDNSRLVFRIGTGSDGYSVYRFCEITNHKTQQKILEIGETENEAICKCAVEYFKLMEDK